MGSSTLEQRRQTFWGVATAALLASLVGSATVSSAAVTGLAMSLIANGGLVLCTAAIVQGLANRMADRPFGRVGLMGLFGGPISLGFLLVGARSSYRIGEEGPAGFALGIALVYCLLVSWAVVCRD